MIAKNSECFFDLGQVLGINHHGGRAAVPGDDHSFVVVLDAIDDLGQMVAHAAQ